MTHNNSLPTAEAGLLAFGSSSGWDIAVDECVSGGWTLELDGPRAYLVFQLSHPGILQHTLNFLEVYGKEAPPHPQPDVLVLGHFGSAPVSLRRDNEDFPRCFLVVGPMEQAVLRLSLDEDDIGMIRQALSQVLADLL